jgi:hypothetical protein
MVRDELPVLNYPSSVAVALSSFERIVGPPEVIRCVGGGTHCIPHSEHLKSFRMLLPRAFQQNQT